MDNKGINKQFYIYFFEEKHVDLQQDIFLSYYNNIFPCPHLFVEFLLSTNREQQLISAKRIIKRMFWGTDNSNLQNFFDGLINLEESNLVEQSNRFFPRDHAVHSINTYLLGIYLFFFSRTFNKQLNVFFSKDEFKNSYDSTPSHNSFLSFLDAWKFFSLNHDIGYPFELLINSNGEINERNCSFFHQFNNGIKNSITTEYAIYELQFLTCLRILGEKSVCPMASSLSSRVKKSIHSSGKKVEYVMLDSIYSYKTLSSYIESLEENELIVVVKSQDLQTICYYYYNNVNWSVEFIHGYSSIIDSSVKNKLSGIKFVCDIDKILQQRLILEFYYPKDKCSEFLISSIGKYSPYQDDIKDLSTEILRKLSVTYASISDEHSYNDFLFEVYLYIKQILVDDQNELRKNTKQYFIEKNSSFWKYLHSIVLEYFKSIPNVDSFENVENYLTTNLQLFAEKFINSGNALVTVENFLQSGRKKITPVHLLNRIKSQYRAQLETAGFYLDDGDSMNGIGWNCVNSVFSHSDIYENSETAKEHIKVIIKKFYSLACNEGLIGNKGEFNRLLNYSTEHSMFDHGIISAYFAIENYTSIKIIQDALKEMKLRSVKIQELKPAIFQNACYAIFIHNIYSSFFSSLNCNTTNKHDLLNNPFVYFSLFCDNMQIWDRPYRINQGKVDLKSATISGNEMSIRIYNDKVYLQCETLESEEIINKYRESLDEYLLNGSQIINLSIISK